VAQTFSDLGQSSTHRPDAFRTRSLRVS
jgi:hypothetical protein